MKVLYGQKTITWGPSLKRPGNFSGQESYFMSVRLILTIQILLVFEAEQ